MQSYDIPLHDIKPLVEVEEYSLYYLIGYIGIGIIALSIILYIAYYFYKKSKIVSLRMTHKENINNIDFSDTKNAAYAVSIYGSIFQNDSLAHTKAFSILTTQLEEYKYRKNVNSFNDEALSSIESYKALINA